MASTADLEGRVRAALATVIDPELRVDLVSAGMIKEVRLDGPDLRLNVELTTPACPLKERIESDVRDALSRVSGLGRVDLEFSARVRASAPTAQREAIPGIAHIVAVASGKGGVGKSTVASNVAVALAQSGARTGLLDADIHGPSVAKLFGLPSRQPEARNQRMMPYQVAMGGPPLKIMSMAFFLQDDQPVVWRGPMLHKALQQFLRDVEWGELDYLLLDLPPGTGDVQLSLSQLVPLTGALIVTTPQDVALLDVRRAVLMFDKVEVPILGVVENMASFECPGCHATHAIFGSGGGEAFADSIDAPFLGSVPIATAVREGGDAGRPIVAAPDPGPSGRALVEVARRLAGQVSIRAAASSGGYAMELPVMRG